MAKKSTRSRRRFRRGSREFIWVTGFRSDLLLNDGLADETFIVSRADWARDASASGHLEKGCIVRRTIITGIMTKGVMEDNSGSLGAGFVGVRKKDEDDATVLDLSVNMLDEDWYQSEWLHTYHESSIVATLTWMADAASFVRWHWDTKVARKLTTEDQVAVAIAGLGNGASGSVFAFQYGWRVLLELPG